MHFKNFKFYIGNKVVLTLKNLNINSGINLIFGPSWSGKTTFLKLLYVLSYKKDPKKFLNNYINFCGDVKVDEEASFSFQEFNLIDELNVIDNFNLFLNNKWFLSNKLEDLLNYFEINKSILNQKVSWLSWWEKARITFILTRLKNKKLILIDETDSFLNEELKIKFYKFLQENANDKIFFFATHNKDAVNFLNPTTIIYFD